jgi:hypothetical protein
MDELWKQVEREYLLFLPCPAPTEEQKYLGDMLQPDGSFINIAERQGKV